MKILSITNIDKSTISKWLISLAISLFISSGCYLINNSPYPLLENLEPLYWSEYLVDNLFHKKIDRSDVLFVNVSHDKDIAKESYSNGNLIGTTDITNRSTLLKFLQLLAKSNNYEYVFLDIRFEDGITTPTDSALFNQISRMRNICYSRHSDIETLDNIASNKAVINNAAATALTSFTRYQFLQKGEESIPLRIFQETDSLHRTIHRYGLFYTFDGKLCYNSPFLCIPEDFYDGHDVNGEQNYYDLGPILLNPELVDEEMIECLTDNKIIIVGDFDNDVHDTYRGRQPGSYIIYLAYKSLVDMRHVVFWPYVILMLFVYSIISFSIITKKNIFIMLGFDRFIKSKIGLFLLDMVGYSLILTIINIITYIAFGMASNVVLPSIVFAILTFVINLKKLHK